MNHFLEFVYTYCICPPNRLQQGQTLSSHFLIFSSMSSIEFLFNTTTDTSHSFPFAKALTRNVSRTRHCLYCVTSISNSLGIFVEGLSRGEQFWGVSTFQNEFLFLTATVRRSKRACWHNAVEIRFRNSVPSLCVYQDFLIDSNVIFSYPQCSFPIQPVRYSLRQCDDSNNKIWIINSELWIKLLAVNQSLDCHLFTLFSKSSTRAIYVNFHICINVTVLNSDLKFWFIFSADISHPTESTKSDEHWTWAECDMDKWTISH